MADEFRVTPVPFNAATMAQVIQSEIKPLKKMLQDIIARLDALEASRTQANTQSRRQTS